MQTYARHQTEKLLRDLADEVKSAADSANADAIHDLRVAIRRLSRCLRVFAQFYPDASWKKVRQHLSELLQLAGVVRDRDIALELLAKAGVSKCGPVIAKLAAERSRAERRLLAEVKRWHQRGLAKKWRSQLHG